MRKLEGKKANSIDKCTIYIFSIHKNCLDLNLSVKILLTNTVSLAVSQELAVSIFYPEDGGGRLISNIVNLYTIIRP
jgi:hypothetical protein